MPFTPKAGLYYPAPTQAPATAADMMQLALNVDGTVPLPATTEADRDVKYSGLSRGIVYTTQAPWMVWLRAGTEWLEVYSDTGWVTSGFAAASGWTLNTAKARRVGVDIEVRLQVTRTGANITASSTGNVGDTPIATIPLQFAAADDSVSTTFRGSTTSGATSLNSNGTVSLVDLHSDSTLSNGQTGWLSFRYFKG